MDYHIDEYAEQVRVPEEEQPTENMADRQVAEAIEFGRRDFSKAPKWAWAPLHNLLGPVLPGELWIVGARTGQGKTTFLLNWMEYLATMQGTPWLFIGMEMDPKQLRRKWAAFRCGLNEEAVLTSNWTALPDGSRERLERDLLEQATEPLKSVAHFAPARRIDVPALRRWVDFACEHSCQVVVIDHLHRMTFPGSAEVRPQMAEAVREAKELAITHEISIVAAAQLNRGGRDVLGAYKPQPLEALKECGAIEEEADAVVMLSRCLKPGVTQAQMTAVREGTIELGPLVDHDVMKVTCRKHRRNGSVADGRYAALQLRDGLLRERIAIA